MWVDLLIALFALSFLMVRTPSPSAEMKRPHSPARRGPSI